MKNAIRVPVLALASFALCTAALANTSSEQAGQAGQSGNMSKSADVSKTQDASRTGMGASGASGTDTTSDTMSTSQAGTMTSGSTTAGATTEAKPADAKATDDMKQMKAAMLLNRIHHINQKEITLSQMAIDKSQTQQIKDYANRMVSEHGQADQKVQELAKSRGITLEKFQPATHEKVESDRLGKLSGAQFDQAYMDAMRMGHKHALRDFEMARNEIKDPELKRLISELTPTVRAHHKSAASLKPSTQQQAGQASQSE